MKTIGHSLKKLGPSQKTLRHPWCPRLVTGLIGHSLKIWAPLRKLFAPPGVPSWLRAWAKPSDGLAFLTNKSWCDIDPEMVIDKLFEKKRRLNFIFQLCSQVFSKVQIWLLASSDLFLCIHLHTFSWFWLFHNQLYSQGQHSTALRFPLLLMLIENEQLLDNDHCECKRFLAFVKGYRCRLAEDIWRHNLL